MNVHHRSALVALSAVLALIAAALAPAAAWRLMAISSTPPTPPHGGLARPIAIDKPANGAYTVELPAPAIPPSLPNQPNPPSTKRTNYLHEKLKYDAREVLAFLYTYILTFILCNLDGDEDPDDDDDDEDLPNPNPNDLGTNNGARIQRNPRPRDLDPLPDFYARILPRLLFCYLTLSGGACIFWNTIPGDSVGRVRCALHLLAVVEAADREATMPRWVRGGMGCAQRAGRAWGVYLAVAGDGGRPGLVRLLAAGVDLGWILREDLWWFRGWLGEVWDGGVWGL
jgi:hypothetical protein